MQRHIVTRFLVYLYFRAIIEQIATKTLHIFKMGSLQKIAHIAVLPPQNNFKITTMMIINLCKKNSYIIILYMRRFFKKPSGHARYQPL